MLFNYNSKRSIDQFLKFLFKVFDYFITNDIDSPVWGVEWNGWYGPSGRNSTEIAAHTFGDLKKLMKNSLAGKAISAVMPRAFKNYYRSLEEAEVCNLMTFVYFSQVFAYCVRIFYLN